MQLLPKTFFILLQLFIIPWCLAEPSQPYCYKNVTDISYKVVTKTRLKTVSSKNFFRKMIAKKETQVEVYEEQEPVYKIKLERICCEGYKLSEYKLCEPQCVENGCPPHSYCVEPEVCACQKGYISVRSTADAKHYCEPLCEEPCPEYSECVGPNQCACIKGYYNEQKKCKPYCASGCPYGGVCIHPNICNCPTGYAAKRASCLPSEEEQMESSTYYPEFTDSEQSRESSFLQVETDIDTSNDNIDPNQVFEEDIEITTYYVTDVEYASSSEHSLAADKNCPHDHIFHKGQCRSLKFVSNEIDCWLKPCQDKNSVCLENGTCACNEGYQWFSAHNVNETKKGICLTTAEYATRIQNLAQEPQDDTTENKSTNITLISFITLGILIIVAALVFLSWKLFHRQTGKIDVQGKNLACVYDHRSFSENEKSVICNI